MKYRIIPINILLFIINIFSQGWQWQNPLPFGDPISKVYFVDSQHGWMLPQNPTLLRTINGGQSWEILYTDIVFNDVHFINASEGWGIGRPYFEQDWNSIFHTTDGGSSWDIQLADTTVRYDILFVDSLYGWASGDAGTLMHTNDGGNTWQRQAEGEIVPWEPIFGVLFLNRLKGWAVGGLTWGIHTIDGGQTWERDSSLAEVQKLIYTDSLHLWGISEWQEHVWRSSDGGENWDFTDIVDTTVQVHVIDIFALNNSELFVATNLGVYKSNNGGQNWFFHSPKIILSFYYLNTQEAWGTGSSFRAELLHSLDGGQTWNDLVTVNNPRGFELYRAVDFVDSQTGWIIGDAFVQGSGNFILKTIDGGQSWVEQQSNANPQLRNLCFIDAEYGWIVGKGGIIRHTFNGGESWVPQTSGTNFSLEAISFVNRRKGWIVGGAFTNNGAEGIILHTSDSGQTWVDQTPGLITGLSGVSFVDSLNGWVVGGGGSTIDYGIILHTSDGGQSWEIQRQHPELEMNDVEFVDSLYGWAIGYDPVTDAGIIHTTDGGVTWLGQYGAGGLDIKFVDRQHGWAVWLFGHIYHTSDGGQTWLRQKSYTSQWFNKIDFINLFEGWVVGYWGPILHTTTGGVTAIYQSPEPPSIVKDFFLYPNYPNPFNPETTIPFQILKAHARVQLLIFDILGRKIRNLFDGELPPGNHEIKWDGRDSRGRGVSSGIYFYRLDADGYVKVRKMLKLD